MQYRAWIAAGLLMVAAMAPVVSGARDTQTTSTSPGPAGLSQAASGTDSEAGSDTENPEAPFWKKRKHGPAGFQARFFAE